MAIDNRFVKEKVQLLLSQPFYGSLIVRLQLREWDEPTCATDGQYLFVPRKIPKDWSNEHIRGILAHETLHCALGHVFRLGNRDMMKWNVAADYAINWILSKNGFTLPEGSLIESKFTGMHAEKIYSLLPDPIKIKIPIDLLQPGNGNNGKNKGQKGKGIEVGSIQPLSKEDIEEAKAKAKELEQEWKESLAHALEADKHSSRGHIPGELSELINEILFPKISWQEILYKYLQAGKGNSDFTAYPFDRRHLYREVYLPSMIGESIELCIGIDTSGSISHNDLVRYFSEIRGICSIFGEYTIHLFECDSVLAKEEIITPESDIPNIAVGRGGTDFRPVFNKIKELELEELPLVYFTDLDGVFPNEKRNDVYWIIQEGIKSKAPFGTIIEIENGKK